MGCCQVSDRRCVHCDRSNCTYIYDANKCVACKWCLYDLVYEQAYTHRLGVDEIHCVKCHCTVSSKIVKKVLESREFKTDSLELSVLQHPARGFTCRFHHEYTCSENGVLLKCGHSVCTECLKQIISYYVREGRVEQIKCWCKFPVSLSIINELAREEELDRFWDFYIRYVMFHGTAQTLVVCPSCQYRVVVARQLKYFHCPKCTSPTCIRCNLSHSEEECVRNTLKIEGVSRCPKCSEGTQQVDGCNVLRCNWRSCKGKTIFCALCQHELTPQNFTRHFNPHRTSGSFCRAMPSEAFLD